MAEWPSVPLTSALDFKEGPGILAVDFRDSGTPLIRLAGVKPGAHILDGCNFLDPEAAARKWSQFRLKAGDVLLSTSASLGEVAVVPPEGEGAIPYTGLIRFRPAHAGVTPEYISIALTSDSFKRQIEAMGVGSVMRHFGPMHLRQMTIELPPLAEQRAIAEVLGALDDKIAANTRLATTADNIAVTLFRRAVADAEFGTSTFGDVAEVGGGGTPSTKVADYWDGEIPWASPTDITRLGGRPYLFDTARGITSKGLANCSSKLYPAGSVLMTSRATIGAFALAQVPTAVNQGFIVVVPPDETLRYWLFHEMRDRVDEFLTHANGATFLELSRGTFRRLQVREASRAVMENFSARARDLHAAAAGTLKENLTLAATRDALLPALMSGALRVRDAERLAETLT